MHKYPRLLLLLASCLLAYALFHIGAFNWLHSSVKSYTLPSVFIAGMLLSFGFTAPIGVVLLLEVGHLFNPFLAAPIAGLGALLSDYCLLRLIRFSIFHDEIHRLKTTRFFQYLHTLFHHETISEKLRTYLLWAFVGFIIASPLPDEFGVSLIGSLPNVKSREFALFCFVLNTVGIFVILTSSYLLS